MSWSFWSLVFDFPCFVGVVLIIYHPLTGFASCPAASIASIMDYPTLSYPGTEDQAGLDRASIHSSTASSATTRCIQNAYRPTVQPIFGFDFIGSSSAEMPICRKPSISGSVSLCISLSFHCHSGTTAQGHPTFRHDSVPSQRQRVLCPSGWVLPCHLTRPIVHFAQKAASPGRLESP